MTWKYQMEFNHDGECVTTMGARDVSVVRSDKASVGVGKDLTGYI